ncbi:hypothetical protein F511_39426 [Dorcoceras hygrometricum]|uniref:Uncharacterized protein n=1 Tax=Dorcoceras hygrometricum TaxID=472368 RepID=A0A2Z7A8M9_9LAMI|nr:hypothetical protein F511_39426 [Dorcoceras hygrometricum]
MSLFDLQDVCIAIGSLATLDLPMVVDLIGIYVLKGPYCTLTTTNWFLQALSVIPSGSWRDVARLIGGRLNPFVDLIGESTAAYSLKCRFPRETGPSQCLDVSKELEQFFDTALVQDGDITGAISGKYLSVSQSQFAEIFALPTEGLVTFSDVPKHLVYKERSIFSKSGEQVEIHGKKRFLKYEYRLLNDILAKAITVKAGSSMLLPLNVFNDDRNSEGISFQASKILSVKTVNTYIATNQTIDARGQTEEQGMASEAIVKRKSKSKKKSVSTDDTPVEIISEIAGSKKRPATEGDAPVIPKKRRTVKSKASPSTTGMDIFTVAQDVVPIQIVEPTPAAAAVVSPAPKRRYPNRKLILSTGSDDETLDEKESMKETAEVTVRETTVAPSDEVDVIIEQVIAETSKLGTDETEKEEQRIDETDIGDDFAQWLEESFKDFASRENEPVVETTSKFGKELRQEERVTVEQRLDIVDEGNDYWRSSCRMSLFVNKKKQPEVVIEENFVPHVFFIEPVQYCGAAPSLIKTWGWARVCTEIVRYNMFGCLRPVRMDVCKDIVVDLEVQSIPEIDSDSSDGCTVYRSPSLISQEADSSVPEVHFALGPVNFGAAQEEQSYYVQSPESPPPTFQHQVTSASSSGSPMHFTRDDIPLLFSPSTLMHLKVAFYPSYIKLNKAFVTPLRQQEEAFKTLIQGALQESRNIDNVQTLRFNEFFKNVLAQNASVFTELADVRKEVQEMNAKSQAQANYIILTDQLGQLVDYINRGGNGKKGEGESRQGPQPPPAVQIRDRGNAGGSGDAVRTTEITQADIDAAIRQIMERMMCEDREREKESRIMISGCSESGFGQWSYPFCYSGYRISYLGYRVRNLLLMVF